MIAMKKWLQIYCSVLLIALLNLQGGVGLCQFDDMNGTESAICFEGPFADDDPIEEQRFLSSGHAFRFLSHHLSDIDLRNTDRQPFPGGSHLYVLNHALLI